MNTKIETAGPQLLFWLLKANVIRSRVREAGLKYL